MPFKSDVYDNNDEKYLMRSVIKRPSFHKLYTGCSILIFTPEQGFNLSMEDQIDWQDYNDTQEEYDESIQWANVL